MKSSFGCRAISAMRTRNKKPPFLVRLFNSGQIKQATGDVFGRIYEYFLAKFSVQKAHDNGEFFTPSSLVQTIVNVIEPDHGIVFDPACGSGGMFVQSSHFIEQEGGDTARRGKMVARDRSLRGLGLARDIVLLAPEAFERDRYIPGTIARPAWQEGRVL